MPVWDFECQKCGRVERDVPAVRADPDLVTPTCCEQRMELLYGQHALSIFQDYTTTNIDPDGRPIHVTSQRQLSALENQYGLRRIDDPELVMKGGKMERVRTHAPSVFFDMRRRA